MKREELEITAELAYIALNEREIPRLQEEIAKILEHFSIMEKWEINNLQPTTHAFMEKNRLRNDTAGEPQYPDALLANAEELEDRFIVIPNVL